MRHAALIVLVTIVLALGATTGWYWWTAWRFQQTTDDAYVQSDITVISPKIEGYIKEVWVEENQQGDQKPRLVGRPMLHKASQKVINRSTGTSPMQWWKVRLVPGWLSSA